MTRSHKRFFVLQGIELRYFASAPLGVPEGEKGSIDVGLVKAVACDNGRMQLTTPGRLWKLRTKKVRNHARRRMGGPAMMLGVKRHLLTLPWL